MKKLFLSIFIIVSAASSPLLYSMPWKTAFDLSMIAASIISLDNWPLCIPEEPKRNHLSFAAVHLGIWAYALPSLWKTYQAHRDTGKHIRIKLRKGN